MKAHWNKRYAETPFAYGKEPNAFFAEEIQKLKPGKLFLPAEGEGRNAVFAARLGWEVYALDYSEEGKNKAELLAREAGVTIQYKVESIENISFPENEFDAIGLVFAHFPPTVRQNWYRSIVKRLKTGGTLLLEGFETEHIKNQKVNPKAGGPPNVEMLFSENQLKRDFNLLDIEFIKSENRVLEEGLFHQGMASLIQLKGVRN